MALPDMIVRIGLDSSDFTERMKGVRSEIQKTSKELTGVGQVGQQLGQLGQALTVGLTLPIVGFAAAAVTARSKMEQIEAGLVAVSGSAEKAARLLSIVKEAAKLPGLTFEDAARGAINLTAVGMSAEQVDRILRAFGNALAAVGRGGEDLSAVIVQLTQMASKSKIVAGDLKPILERVPQAVGIIKEAFGTIDTEELQKKKISTQDFIEVVVAGLERLPPAATTAKNEFDNARDAITMAMAQVGAAIAPIAVTIAQTLVPAVQALADAFSALPSPVQTAAVGIGLLAASIGPVIFGLGQMITAVRTVSLGLVALQGAIAASAAWASFVALLKAAAVAAAAFAAPIALVALKIAAVAAIIGGAVYGLAKLGEVLFGAGSNASWLAKKIEGAFGSLKNLVFGSKNAAEQTSKLEDATKKSGSAQSSAAQQAMRHAEQIKKQEQATESAKKATEGWRKKIEEMEQATVKWRTESLKADATWQAIIKAASRSVEEYDKARKALIEYKARQIEGRDTTWAMEEASRSFDQALNNIERSTAAATNEIQRLAKLEAPQLVSALGAAKGSADELSRAFSTLGVETAGSLTQKRKEAEAAYEAIKNSGIATAGEIEKAHKAYLQAVAKEEEALTGKVSQETKARLEEAKGGSAAMAKEFEKSFEKVSTAISNSTQKMVGILIGTESGSVMDALKTMGQGIISALVEPWMDAFGDLIENGVKKLIGWLISETGLKGAISAVGGWIGGLFGGAGGAAGAAAAGAAGAAGAGAAGAAGGAAGAAGAGAAGAVAGAVGSIATGLIGGGIAAAGSIIGSFITSAKLGGDMGRIEENTRFTQIALIGEKGVIDILWGFNEHFWVWRGLYEKIAENTGWAWEMLSAAVPLALDRMAEIRDRIIELPDRIKPVSVTVEGNVIGNEEFLDYMAREIGKRLSAQGA